MTIPKRKVLVLGKYYPPYRGGIEHVTELCAQAISGDYEVHVVANAHGPETGVQISGNVIVNRLRVTANILSQPLAAGLLASFRIDDYDLIHLHGPNPYAASILWMKWIFSKKRPKIIVTHHMDIYGRGFIKYITGGFYKILLIKTEFVIVTSEKNAKISKDLPHGIDVEVVPLSIDPSHYSLNQASKSSALEWRRSKFGSAPLVGFIGRHARYKGLDVLIQAASSMPEAHVLIAGDGELTASLKHMVDSNGLSSRVHFLGVVSAEEKSKILLAIDVFAFPSTEITEAFGVSQLEAMLHGVPVVATNLPTGVTDVAIHNETALVVPPGDPDALAIAIRRILNDPTLATSLGSRAKMHVLDNFTDDRISMRFRNLVSNLLPTRRDPERLRATPVDT